MAANADKIQTFSKTHVKFYILSVFPKVNYCSLASSKIHLYQISVNSLNKCVTHVYNFLYALKESVPADVTELTLAQKYFEEILYQIS
jgi:hypothetical protein